MKNKIQKSSFILAVAALCGSSYAPSWAQTVQDEETVEAGLQLPNGQKFYGILDPNTRRATAIINGEILTGTDVEHRLSLLLALRNVEADEERRQSLKPQILADLIDETLQIQEAAANEIEVSNIDLERRAEARSQQMFNRPLSELDSYLREIGSSRESFIRLVRGQVAWSRLLSLNVRVNVSEQEVNAVLDKLKANKGKTEYRVGEIYLSFTPQNQDAVIANARQIVSKLQQGSNFGELATQFSEATTRASAGDLGFVRPETLPDSMSEALKTLEPGQIATVPVPGGLSIMLLVDKRQILTTDVRDSILNLKQISIIIPKETEPQQATVMVDNFASEIKKIKGCGQVEDVARNINAVVGSDPSISARQLPAQLQEVMLNIPIGQVTSPFQDPQGVTAFILCGRDQPEEAKLPTFDEILVPMENERIDRRANIYLRDLRRDAIIEYN